MFQRRNQAESVVGGMPAGTQFAYAVPFEWGEVYVTAEANRVYDLTPLTADTRPVADIVPKPDLKPYVSVTLMSPEESPYRADEEADIARPHGAGMVGATISRKKVELALAMPMGKAETTRDMLDVILKEARAAHVIDEGDDFRNVLRGADDLPIDQAIETEYPMMVTHTAAQIIDRAMRDGVASWSMQLRNRNLLRHLSYTGGLYFSGMVGMDSLAVLANGNEQYATAPGIAIGGLYMAFGLTKIRSSLKHNLRTSEVARMQAGRAAETLASHISNDFHAIYCRHVFDARMNADFPDSQVD